MLHRRCWGAPGASSFECRRLCLILKTPSTRVTIAIGSKKGKAELGPQDMERDKRHCEQFLTAEASQYVWFTAGEARVALEKIMACTFVLMVAWRRPTVLRHIRADGGSHHTGHHTVRHL